MRNEIRNIAIIAHVDHGKTTLVDGLLRQSGTIADHQKLPERAMDRLDLEQERGITILSKNTSIRYQDVTINIVDTPGHADFGGEVERVLCMVDAVLLLVDAYEGPMPQTKFVLRKALSHNLSPIIVVINKIDRAEARPDEVLDQVFDLFVALHANEEQLDFPVLYASGRDGWATTSLDSPRTDLTPLLDAVLALAPAPSVDTEGPLQMQAATIDYNEFVGRIAVGRIQRGRIQKGDQLICIDVKGTQRPGKVSKLVGYVGLGEVELQSATAGEIIGFAGVPDALPGETFCAPGHPAPLPPIAVDEPTVAVDLLVNNGPWAGKDGRYVTSRNLRDRLHRETQSNVSLRVEDTGSPDVFRVAGRGELHLCILLETMRREGYEMMVSMPRVILREGPSGQQEPYEEVTIECDEEFSGAVIQELNQRGGEMTDLRQAGSGTSRIEYIIPSRGLIGYRSRFLTQTRGTGLIYHTFLRYGPYRGPFQRRIPGVLVSTSTGRVTTRAVEGLQERGQLFVAPGDEVYTGQICGECSRPRDLPVNPCKTAKLDNIRSSTKDIDVRLNTARRHTLEESLEYINEDELVEVTPNALRMRKRILDEGRRRRLEKATNQQ